MSGTGTELVDRLLSNIDPIQKGTEEPARPPFSCGEAADLFFAKGQSGYTKDQYFHFFGGGSLVQHNIVTWNRDDFWKKYFEPPVMLWAFAEDAFGDQFGFSARPTGIVYSLSVITGQITRAANCFEDFIEDLIVGDDVLPQNRELAETFYRESRTSWKPFKHISYKVHPFLGGKTNDVRNLELSDSLVNLRITGQVIAQARRLPAGTRILDVRIDAATSRVELVTDIN